MVTNSLLLFLLIFPAIWGMGFEENLGQFGPDARYGARTGRSTTLVEAGALHFIGAESRFRLEFVNRNGSGVIRGEREAGGKVHYLTANLHARTYERIRMAGVYDGVDVVVYFRDGNLEFDFELAPGFRAETIRMRIAGNGEWSVDADGALTLGGIRLGAPVAYQSTANGRRSVSAQYIREGSRVALRVGDYDAGLPLVVDPVVSFTRYVGGKGEEGSPAVAVDAGGNSYIGGIVAAQPETLNTTARLIGGAGQIFVAKYDAAGRMVYTTYITGPPETPFNSNSISAIAVDAAGQLVVTGNITGDSEMPVVSAAQPRHGGGGQDAFVMKLNSRGSESLFSTYLGGAGYDNARALAIASSGDIVVCGSTRSREFPVSAGYTTTFTGQGESFLTKYSAGGQVVFSTFLGAALQPPPATSPLFLNGKIRSANALAVDPDGNIYVGGHVAIDSAFTIIGGDGGDSSSGSGVSDAFAARIDASGKRVVWTTYLGGSGGDYGYAIAVDGDRSVYLGGVTLSNDFPLKNALQPRPAGRAEAFLAKLDARGLVAFTSYFGGEDDDYIGSLGIDGGGQIAIVGMTASKRFPLQGALRQIQSNTEAFYTRMSSDGARILYSTYLGGSGFDGYAKGALAGNGDVVVAMQTGSTDVTGTDTSLPIPGGADLVLVRLTVRIAARPPAVSLPGADGAQALVLETTPGQPFSAVATTERGGAWLRVTPAGGIASTATGLMVSANPAVTGGLPAGRYLGLVTISTDEGGVARVPVTLELPPQIAVSAAAVTFAGSVGAAALLTREVTVGAGAAPMVLTASAATENGGGWLRVSPSRFTTPATIAIGADASALPAGSYMGTVTLRGDSGVAAVVRTTLQVSAGAANPAAVAIDANGGDVDVAVVFAAGVNWAAAVDQSWVTIVSGATGIGPGTVRVRIAENGGSTVRTATLRMGGIAVPIAQTGPLRLSGSTTEVGFRWNRDFPSRQEARVTVSSGGTAVDITATTSESWLSASISSGRTPDTISIRAATDGLADGSYRGRVIIRSALSTNMLEIPVALTVAARGPAISRAGLVNAASLLPANIAPNQIMSLFGSGLQCANTPSILLSGERATVLAAAEGQVNFATPATVPSGRTILEYRCADSASAQIFFDTAPVAAALFSADGTGRGQAAAINEDGSYSGSGAGYALVEEGRALQLYGTGFGGARAVDADGLSRLAGTVKVTVGGVDAVVLFAGLAPGATNGLQQINVLLGAETPAGSAVPLEVSVGEFRIQDGVTLAVAARR